MFSAYFDESGMHTGGSGGASRMAVVAGFVAKDEQWAKLSDEWKVVLGRKHIDCFDMNKFEGGYGPFAGMDDNDKGVLLDQLLSLIDVRATAGIAGGLLISDYNEIITDNVRRGVGEPYAVCGQLCLMRLRRWADKHDYQEAIPLFFEDGAHHKGQLLTAFDLIKKHPKLNRPYRVSSLTFLDKRKHPALQAADILAYATYRRGLVSFGGEAKKARWGEYALEKLLRKEHFGELATKDSLREFVEIMIARTEYKKRKGKP
ncbi:MAG TPA: DUF3800 domain-containing protein [Blastocatellia bacterium]|nr:DUF3800 domain-containing protein [Blastocatellia bacterium]